MCHQHLAYAVLGAEPRASCMLASTLPTKQHPQSTPPHTHTLWMRKLRLMELSLRVSQRSKLRPLLLTTGVDRHVAPAVLELTV